jgi:hypothetical protein
MVGYDGHEVLWHKEKDNGFGLVEAPDIVQFNISHSSSLEL